MIEKSILVWLLLAWSFSAHASGIRTVHVNDEKMQAISLRMGKATVLRFPDKPKKVVIGNQNYYSVEFIDNDLTIQPIGDVETNLFVYTPHRTYGFLLKVCHGCRYDDLVYVKWKSRFQPPARSRQEQSAGKTSIPGFKAIGLKFFLEEDLQIEVVRTMADEGRSLRIIDINIKNLTTSEKIKISSLKLVATRRNIPLSGQGYVIEEDSLQGDKSSRARLFLPLSEKRGFSLNAVLGDKKNKVIVGQKFLQ
ncbi:MAG: hypothetical protein MK008_07325 [Bdellovibrionales bacterium]|nr:hypothetical protein [Bdellovibrionales bacterium]